MSTRKPRNFVVRGFDDCSENFSQPTGVIEQFTSYTEEVTSTAVDAAVLMVADPRFKSLATRAVHVFDIEINLDVNSVREVRHLKSDIREVLKRWAEKSRVRGQRGWRSSAIREPLFEKSKQKGMVHVKTTIILGDLVIYSTEPNMACQEVDFDAVCAEKNFSLLARELTKRVDYFDGLVARSKLGTTIAY